MCRFLDSRQLLPSHRGQDTHTHTHVKGATLGPQDPRFTVVTAGPLNSASNP